MQATAYPPPIAAPPSPPTVPPPTQRWLAGRLWVGPFLVPERRFLLHAPCPSCRGSVCYDEGDFRCMLCARDLAIAELSDDGRVTAFELRAPGPPALIRIAPKRSRETYRALSRLDGTNGLQARVLKAVPRGPDRYVVVEALIAACGVRRTEIRGALDRLAAQGLVEAFSFAGGYRTGYRRPAMSPTEVR